MEFLPFFTLSSHPQNFRWRLTRSRHSASTLSVSTWSRCSYGSVTVVATELFHIAAQLLAKHRINFRIVSIAFAHGLHSTAILKLRDT